jgi:NAD(P)-dependent dehydrogenase (short-subunit alcohol dehydrogenase family)
MRKGGEIYGQGTAMTDSLQVAVVVGAARGIGRAAAERLAARGIVIAAIDRLTDTLANTAANFAENGWHLDVHAADVTERDAVNGAIEKIIAAHGRIDILVNCAGITGVTGIKAHQVDPDDFDVVYQINLKAALLLSQAVLPSMLERNYGRILHVSSIAGKDGDLVAAMPDHQVRYMIDKIPMKRTGTLAEAAAMIDWIVSPECSFTTGFTFDLSGGRAVF